MVERAPHPVPLPIGSADSADAEREKRSQRLGDVLSRVVQGFNGRIFRGNLFPPPASFFLDEEGDFDEEDDDDDDDVSLGHSSGENSESNSDASKCLENKLLKSEINELKQIIFEHFQARGSFVLLNSLIY